MQVVFCEFDPSKQVFQATLQKTSESLKFMNLRKYFILDSCECHKLNFPSQHHQSKPSFCSVYSRLIPCIVISIVYIYSTHWTICTVVVIFLLF